MATILLGICTVLLAWGGFLVGTGAIGKQLPYNIRAGRMVRGFLTEMVGLVVAFGALQIGAKPPLAVAAIVLGLGSGSIAGLFHAAIRNRVSVDNPKS